MTTYAVALQVWDTTHSTAATGAIGVVTVVPMVLIALPGGSIADAVVRRKLVLVMTGCLAVVSGALFLQALAGPGWLWSVYALVAISSAIGAVNAPTRRALIRSTVTPGQLPAALALNRISFQTMLIGGPALAGMVTAAAGLRGCYLIDTVSFAGSVYGVFRMPAALMVVARAPRATRALRVPSPPSAIGRVRILAAGNACRTPAARAAAACAALRLPRNLSGAVTMVGALVSPVTLNHYQLWVGNDNPPR
jgi:hypothetical protein